MDRFVPMTDNTGDLDLDTFKCRDCSSRTAVIVVPACDVAVHDHMHNTGLL